MCTKKLLLWLTLCGVGFSAGALVTRATGSVGRAPQPLVSQVISLDEVRVTTADWGEFRPYFTGETVGTSNVLTAVAVVKPGKTIHRAHRHAEEEYLALIEGSGTWSLDGKESPAKQGDILYVEPWVYHGITNTGDEPLTFLVFRYNSKGLDLPPRPDDRPDEL